LHQLDVNAIGASGHSQGGGSAIAAGADQEYDFEIIVTVPMMPCMVWENDPEFSSQQKGPMLVMTDIDDPLCGSSLQGIKDKSNVDTIVISWEGGIWGHWDVQQPIVRNPSTAWFLAHLKGDDRALDMFYELNHPFYIENNDMFDVWRNH